MGIKQRSGVSKGTTLLVLALVSAGTILAALSTAATLSQARPASSGHTFTLDVAPTLNLQKVWNDTTTHTAYAFQYGFLSVPTSFSLYDANLTLKDSGGHVLTNANWRVMTVQSSDGGAVVCAVNFTDWGTEGTPLIGTPSSCTVTAGEVIGVEETYQPANVVATVIFDGSSNHPVTLTLPVSWGNYNTQPGSMPNSTECGVPDSGVGPMWDFGWN